MNGTLSGEETYNEAWNAMNQGLASLQTARSAIGPTDPNAGRLDGMITALQKDQAILGQEEVKEALAELTDANVLDHLSALTTHLRVTTVHLNNTANDLNAAATIVSIAASIVATVLPLLA